MMKYIELKKRDRWGILISFLVVSGTLLIAIANDVGFGVFIATLPITLYWGVKFIRNTLPFVYFLEEEYDEEDDE